MSIKNLYYRIYENQMEITNNPYGEIFPLESLSLNKNISVKNAFVEWNLANEELMIFLSNNLKTKNFEIRLNDSSQVLVDDEKFKFLIQSAKMLIDKGINVEINEWGVTNTFEEVLMARKQLDEVIKMIDDSKDINGSALSNAEKFLCAYAYVRNRLKFKQSKKDDNLMSSRSLVNVLNNKYVVCVGITDLLKDLGKLMGLKIESVGAKLCPTISDEENHSICVLNIDDEKHNINGVYFSDPTNVGLNHSLITLKDLFPKFFIKLTDDGFKYVAPQTEEFDVFKEKVQLSSSVNDLEEKYQQIMNQMLKLKADEIVSSSNLKNDPQYNEMFKKFAKYGRKLGGSLIKKEVISMKEDFETFKEFILDCDENLFRKASALMYVKQSQTIDLTKLKDSINKDTLENLKALGKQHQRTYSYKKDNVEENLTEQMIELFQ